VIEIDPAKLNQKQRNLLADRLDGIDVCQLWNDDNGTHRCYKPGNEIDEQVGKLQRPLRIKANAPTFEGLMKAVGEDETEVTERQARHRSIALAVSEAGVDKRTEFKLIAHKMHKRE